MERTEVDIQTILYNSKLTCPACDKEILFRTVKSGKVRLIKTDLDLRPIYDILDPSMYEIVVCNSCGFAALKKSLNMITDKKAELIRKKISSKFIERTYPEIYDYEIAIERYKLALLNAIVMEAKDSEKAYLCLKIAWLYRSFSEDQSITDEERYDEYKEEEENYLSHALKGFKEAYNTENFPAMGLDELTIKFLIGELSRRLGDYEEASRWISEVIISRNIGRRLKERALECKEEIKKDKAEHTPLT